MTRIVIVLLSLFLISCGSGFESQEDLGFQRDHSSESGRDSGSNPNEGDDSHTDPLPDSDQVQVISTTYYVPVRVWDPEELRLASPLELQIPSEIPVAKGNAGNETLTAIFDIAPNQFTCRYVGGADIQSPIQSGNAEQIVKGQKYHWVDCDNGAQPGRWVDVQSSVVIYVNGDPAETTKVIAVFSVREALD